MRRLAPLLLLSLLSGCVTAATPGASSHKAESTATVLESGVVCHIGPAGGPNGGPVVADRGIGGTGAPSTVKAATMVAERGIGGTGIVGVISGFASICVDGLEVSYDSAATVDIDGTSAPASALRVGQVVFIQAGGSATAPVAKTISVRNEVAGRIESVELGSGTLTIAGQPVSIASDTWGSDHFQLGDWVAVSGLRREDGMIVASRLDPAASGTLTVRGQITHDHGAVRVGTLVLPPSVAGALKPGQHVTVSGRYIDGHGQVTAAVAEATAASPAGYFGPAVPRLMVQAFVRVANGAIWLNGHKVNAAPGLRAKPTASTIAVVSLQRTSDGSYTAVGLHYIDYRGHENGSARGSAGAGQVYASAAPLRIRHSGGNGSGQNDDAAADALAAAQSGSSTATGDNDFNPTAANITAKSSATTDLLTATTPASQAVSTPLAITTPTTSIDRPATVTSVSTGATSITDPVKATSVEATPTASTPPPTAVVTSVPVATPSQIVATPTAQPDSLAQPVVKTATPSIPAATPESLSPPVPVTNLLVSSNGGTVTSVSLGGSKHDMRTGMPHSGMPHPGTPHVRTARSFPLPGMTGSPTVSLVTGAVISPQPAGGAMALADHETHVITSRSLGHRTTTIGTGMPHRGGHPQSHTTGR